MCNPASFVVSKDSVYFHPYSESHADIFEFNKIQDRQDQDLKPVFVTVEVLPPMGKCGERDYSRPVAEWDMHIDTQSLTRALPLWFDFDEVKARVMKVFHAAWVPLKLVTQPRNRVSSWEQAAVIAGGHVTTVHGNVLVMAGGEIKLVTMFGRIESVHGGCVRDCDGRILRMYGGRLGTLTKWGQVIMEGGRIRDVCGYVRVYDGSIGSIRKPGTVEVMGTGNIELMTGGTLVLETGSQLKGCVHVRPEYPVIIHAQGQVRVITDECWYDPEINAIVTMDEMAARKQLEAK